MFPPTTLEPLAPNNSPDLLPPELPTGPDEKEHFCDSDVAKNLADIIEHLEQHDRFNRDRLIKKWRKQMCYWDNIQYIWWSEFAFDWRTPEQIKEEDPQSDIDPALYAKIINIYRAYGEVIIAAMSAALPTVPFVPDDAENPDDISTSKAYTKIGMLVQKHNFAELLFMKSLYILYNQGVVFGYNENRASAKFGVYENPVVADHNVVTREFYCANCGYSLGSSEVSSMPIGQLPPQPPPIDQKEEPLNAESFGSEEPAPENLPVPAGPGEMGNTPGAPPPSMPPMNQQPVGVQRCPQCGYENLPESDDFEELVPRIVGYETTPKNRECLEVYGPLNVKISPWATRVEDLPYLILETEEHYAKLQDIYPEIAEKIQPVIDIDTFDRSMRTNIMYRGDVATDLCTTRRVWLQPWAFNVLGVKNRKDDIDELRSLYPNGCYCVIINRDLVVEGIPDILQDHWTLTEHPLAESLHAESTGAAVIPIQDMTNEGWNLTLEGIEFGIPELYADPDVLDFDSYGKSEARPGQVSPAKAPSGRSLGEGFFEAKTSSISQEIDKFLNRLERVGQFVSGALPTVFGGSIQGGSGTAREYEMSRSQALQRLQITWKIVKVWWAKMLAKAVRSFAINMLQDEKYVEKRGSVYINVWIRKIHLTGKVGEIEPDVNESFPISWAQKRDMILNLFQGGNEDVMAVLRHPENAGLIALIIGVPELFIPGDDSRNKQLIEIGEMITQEPISIPPPGPQEGPPPDMQGGMPPPGPPPMMGPPPGPPQQGPPMPPPGPPSPGPQEGPNQHAPNEAPGGPSPFGPEPALESSVRIEPTLDDHEVEMVTCQAWLRSEVGLQYKKENPGAYLNVLLHMQAHQKFAAMNAQAQDQQDQQGQDNQPPPKEKK